MNLWTQRTMICRRYGQRNSCKNFREKRQSYECQRTLQRNAQRKDGKPKHSDVKSPKIQRSFQESRKRSIRTHQAKITIEHTHKNLAIARFFVYPKEHLHFFPYPLPYHHTRIVHKKIIPSLFTFSFSLLVVFSTDITKYPTNP